MLRLSLDFYPRVFLGLGELRNYLSRNQENSTMKFS